MLARRSNLIENIRSIFFFLMYLHFHGNQNTDESCCMHTSGVRETDILDTYKTIFKDVCAPNEISFKVKTFSGESNRFRV